MSDPHSVLTDQDYERLREALKRVNDRLASVRDTNEVIEAAKHPDGRRPGLTSATSPPPVPPPAAPASSRRPAGPPPGPAA